MKDSAPSSSQTGSVIAGTVTRRATGLPAARLDRAGTVAAARHPVCGRRAQGGQEPAGGQSGAGTGCRQRPRRFPPYPAARRVLVCQFELPTPQFVSRLASMRRSVGAAADQNLLVDTRAGGNLLSAPQGLNHFLNAARQAAAEVIVLDPLYSTHDQDENDTRSMAALCQSLLRLRDASKAALIVVHHVRKSIGREEIGSAFRGSSALHAVGDSYLLLTRPSAHLKTTVELRFQFRYAAPPPPRLLQLDPQTLCFSAAGLAPAPAPAARKKVAPEHVAKALSGLGRQARYNQLRQQIMEQTECSKRTAQLAIADACRQGSLVQDRGQYRLPF